MRTCVSHAVAAGFVAIVLAADVCAQGQLPDGIYRLTAKAEYQSGCFPPCDCPTPPSYWLLGTLRLTFTGSDPLYENYAVSAVNWIAFAEAPVRIVGSGTYRVGGEFALTQRMELDLYVGAAPLTHFDSGTVPWQSSTAPDLDITISINGIFCDDTVMHVAALPMPPAEIVPYTLGSTSQYQEGCWPPCDCILYDPQPAAGTFGLVQLQTGPLFVEYAVVDVGWLVDGRLPLQGDPHVTGAGIYRIGGEVALFQQMMLGLWFGAGEPVLFDSGMVPVGASFPAIDVAVSTNNFECFNQAFFLHTRPAGPLHPGDLNCDGAVNFDDISPFVLALVGKDVYGAQYPDCEWLNGDINGDGRVNFDDINPFVKCLTSGSCP